MQPTGIPASIVTNYLISHNIVCEKTDYYSFLMLNSLGTTRAKQGTLLADCAVQARLRQQHAAGRDPSRSSSRRIRYNTPEPACATMRSACTSI